MFGGINHQQIEYGMQVDANEENLSGAPSTDLEPMALLQVAFQKAFVKLERELEAAKGSERFRRAQPR